MTFYCARGTWSKGASHLVTLRTFVFSHEGIPARQQSLQVGAEESSQRVLRDRVGHRKGIWRRCRGGWRRCSPPRWWRGTGKDRVWCTCFCMMWIEKWRRCTRGKNLVKGLGRLWHFQIPPSNDTHASYFC